MAKKPLQSKPQRLLTNERWKPYIRYHKETDTWTIKAIQVEEIMLEDTSNIKILVNKKQLDTMARLVAYLYHEKIDEYQEHASDLRKATIRNDLKSADQWLKTQYNELKNQGKKDKKLNKINQEILDELSK